MAPILTVSEAPEPHFLTYNQDGQTSSIWGLPRPNANQAAHPFDQERGEVSRGKL
jgi:hypothetical protein